MQVLKKQKLREQGAAPIYVEQLARAQLLYTEEDRALFEQAWAMSEAHREELVTRTGPPTAAALPLPPRPTARRRGRASWTCFGGPREKRHRAAGMPRSGLPLNQDLSVAATARCAFLRLMCIQWAHWNGPDGRRW